MSQSNGAAAETDDSIQNGNSDSKPKTRALHSTESVSQDLSHSVCVSRRPNVSTPISILIESLIKGLCATYGSDVKKAEQVYKRICDILFQLNYIDESYKMEEFEGMRIQYQRAFMHMITGAAAPAISDAGSPLLSMWPTTDINSHYVREFDEVDYIAGGGFGQVFKVRHKLDGTEYAVKKITIHSEGIDSVKNYLSEVKTFASMNHPNIVQYKAAWLELGPPSTNKAIMGCEIDDSESTHSIKNQNHITTYIYHEEVTDSLPDKQHNDDSSDFVIDFEHSVSGRVHPPKKTRNKQKRQSISEGGESISNIDLREMKEVEKVKMPKSNFKWATLYIQMSLCQSTLKQWLEKRNNVLDPDRAVVLKNDQCIGINTIKQILIQILKGLNYIHSKGIVHHDIKPSNIFIEEDNGNLLIQLGDFGLACPLQSNRHSLAFGTKMYAAPEQLAGYCDPKSDMYSLGIVLYELVESFKTDMERAQHITELRRGHVPAELSERQPEMAQYISQLIRKAPNERPDTSEMLHLLRSSESEQIEHLKLQLAEKDDEIQHLKELLKAHGIQSV